MTGSADDSSAGVRTSAKGGTAGLPLVSWLADLPDERLIRLLELRPDLTQPPPGTLAALAARALARHSVKIATEPLDFLRLSVLDALLVLHADARGVALAELVALIAQREPDVEALVSDAVGDLRDRALVWGADVLRIAPELSTALPWQPGQAIAESLPHTFADITERIAVAAPGDRELLERLLVGSPLGRTKDAAPGAPADRPIPRLLAAALLRRVDDETVILPRQVSQVMRGEQPGPVRLCAPNPVVTTTKGDAVDAAAAGAALDLLREVEVIIETLSATTIPALKSGGVGVREVKRLAKTTSIDETRLGLFLEVATGAGLIAVGFPDSGVGDSLIWAPTVVADRFVESSAAARWELLASTWLNLESRPSLIGSRGPDGKTYVALSDSLRSTVVPKDRRLLLAMLADLPTGAGVDANSASQALTWRRPRWAPRLQPEAISQLLTEAHTLGVIGRGALTTAGRLLLAGEAAGAIDAMAKALPPPIDYFLVQADLTVVVPGPLERDLADQLAGVADVESAGAAMVYRVSEASVRHALDTGMTASSLQSFFERYSKTLVPQGLTYLIGDVARRHGQLRVGMATSFVRCEDPALLAQAMAIPAAEQIELRLLAPTVAISQAPIADVLAALRTAGLAPAAEDASGTIVDLRARGVRVPTTPGQTSPFRSSHAPNSQTLAGIVSVLRKVASAPFNNVRIDPAVAMALLQQAVRSEMSVVLGYVDPAGVATQRVVHPITLRGGQLSAWDSASGRVREFSVHRITSVVSDDGG
ncbi:MAG: helicase-associated domain-containing protein [Mycobacterium sp.]